MIYNPFTPPSRSALLDTAGNPTRPWLDWMAGISRKTGRSMLWRGAYDEDLEYAVCDVVRSEDGSLWTALQAQPVTDLGSVEPGTDETVWERITEPAGGSAHGIPAGGEEGQFLVKLSDDDYDVGWVDIPGLGTHAELLTDGAGSFITAGGDFIYVTGVPD